MGRRRAKDLSVPNFGRRSHKTQERGRQRRAPSLELEHRRRVEPRHGEVQQHNELPEGADLKPNQDNKVTFRQDRRRREEVERATSKIRGQRSRGRTAKL